MASGQLIYIADPMCSWCWGFSPVMASVIDHFGDNLPVKLLLGGLRPGTTEGMSDSMKLTIREHWSHVQAATGQPFELSFFERGQFIYDTEPPSRAIVAVRSIDPDAAFKMLQLIHHAFYAENMDVTDTDVLADLAGKTSVDMGKFDDLFISKEIRAETLGDFDTVRGAGINGFPALIAGDDSQGYEIITVGYRPWEDIESLIVSWMERRAMAEGAD
jgi:putative protein-disulfide isomerase